MMALVKLSIIRTRNAHWNDKMCHQIIGPGICHIVFEARGQLEVAKSLQTAVLK